MGDHRFSVKITLVGVDGEEHKIDWWLNWREDKPEHLYKAVCKLAREAGLQVEDKTYLFDE